MCFIQMLYVFYLDVAYVYGYAYKLQVYISNVSSVLDVCCKCFIWMLHMFQWLYTHVASVYSKYSIYFRRMLQVFLSRCCICCGCYTHMLQEYVANVSPVSDVCCRSASCCSISRRRMRAHAETVPVGVAITTCSANEVDVDGPHLHAHHQARGEHH